MLISHSKQRLIPRRIPRHVGTKKTNLYWTLGNIRFLQCCVLTRCVQASLRNAVLPKTCVTCMRFCVVFSESFLTFRSLVHIMYLFANNLLLGNIRPQSSQLAEPLCTESGIKSGFSVRQLISTSKKKKKRRKKKKSAGGEWMIEHSPKSSQASQRPSPVL